MNNDFNNLSGKVLIASPYTFGGGMFHKSLIYVVAHTETGSIGVIINHLINRLPLKSIIKSPKFPEDVKDDKMVPVYVGGPVEVQRAVLVHSDEYDKNLLFKFDDGLAVSSNIEIMKDLALGNGPQNSLFIVGYTGWKAGELEFELQNNFWIVSDFDKDLMFSERNELKWEIALNRLGIDESMFASTLGHC